MKPARKKWVAIVFAVIMTANVYAFPTYFAERMYRTWEQLDEALAAGEITPDIYDETDSQVLFGTDTISADTPSIENDLLISAEPSPVGLRYTSRFVQGLDEDRKWKRRDVLRFQRKPYALGAEFEKGLDGVYSIRSLSFALKKSSWAIAVGNFALKYGNSLTVGSTSSQSQLHKKSSLGENLTYPYANRENGLRVDRSIGKLKFSGFLSRLRGVNHYRESEGANFQVSNPASSLDGIGATLLRQKLGQRGGSANTFNYLAPYVQFRFKPWTGHGESSFQINGASAHNYELEAHVQNWSQSYLLFSYGRAYRNLESGGYAYSDYEEETMDEIGLTYRDKRAGRQGIAIEQSYRVDQAGTFAAQIVRWANRNDDRQCLAARLSHTYAHGSKGQKYFVIKTQAIRQDLDMVRGTDLRRFAAINSEWGASEYFTYECFFKIEQRILNSSRRYPFRLRNDLTLRMSPSLSLLTTINFYNSNISSSNMSQLTLAIGQRVSAGDNFGLTTRLQTRYCLATDRCDDWEMRINLDLIL